MGGRYTETEAETIRATPSCPRSRASTDLCVFISGDPLSTNVISRRRSSHGSCSTSLRSSTCTPPMLLTSAVAGGWSMNDRAFYPELVVEQIDLSFRGLDDMERFLAERRVSAEAGAAPDRGDRIVLAQILENTYTAVETALLRISQGFDKSLSPERWSVDGAHAVWAFQALLPRARL